MNSRTAELKDLDKTHEELMDELFQMRQRVAQLEAAAARRAQDEEALRESLERYKRIFESAPLPMFEEDYSKLMSVLTGLRAQGVTDIRGYFDEHPEFLRQTIELIMVRDANAAMVNTFGVESKEALLGPLRIIFETETLDDVFKDLVVALIEGKTYFECETVGRTLDGRRYNSLLSLAVLSKSACLDSVLVTTMDITKLKQTEEALKQYSDDLARSNTELEQFAYVASHDLQEPLRKIQAFGDRLEATNGDALSERGLDYLRRMKDSASRMQNLISDMLTLSRVTTKGQPFVVVELGNVVREVQSDLEVRIEKEGATLDIGDLPAIEADPTQMHQLFLNLIGNAVKFRREDVAPVVKVRSELLTEEPSLQAGGRWSQRICRITIQDNGIGFDQKHAERIFTIFQRLHGREEYEGTGIGLAICDKIVQRHSGTITAEGTSGQGASFTITLPTKQADGEGSDE